MSRTVICPECGKELTVSDPNRDSMFCRHCGTKIEIAAFVKKAPKQTFQEPIITPPPKNWQPGASSQEPSAEQLRHQHEMEMEQLRYEHELELERIRHENELERERLKYQRAEEAERTEPVESTPSASKAKKRSTEKRSLSWKAGHFCKKHPIWTIIIVYCLFMGIFGGTSNSSTSSSSSASSSSGLSNASHYKYVYCHTESGDPTSYYLFNFDDEKVCFIKTSMNKAWIANLQTVESENDFEAVFYFTDGTVTRKFKFSDMHILDVTEIVSSDSPSENSYQYEEIDPNGAMDILGTVTTFADCSSPA